jgi:hypothetical protein
MMGLGLVENPWTVVVNDPDMSKPHRFVIHTLDERLAVAEAARLAILIDPRGAGMAGSWVSLPERRRQSEDRGIVECVANYAMATRIPAGL